MTNSGFGQITGSYRKLYFQTIVWSSVLIFFNTGRSVAATQKNLPRKTLAKLRNWAGVLQLGGGPFSSACTGPSRLLDDAPGGPCTLKSGQGGRPSHARPTNYTLAPASPMQAPLGARHRCWPPGALGSQMPHGHSNHTPAPRCCTLVPPN